MRVNRSDLAISVLVIGVLALLYRESNNMPKLAFTDLGPAFFPRIVFGATALLCVILLAQSFRGRNTGRQAAPDKPVPGTSWLKWGSFTLFVAYVALLPKMGYLWSTVTFLIVMMWLLGPRKISVVPTILSVAVITTLGVRYVFGTVLKLFLP